MKKALKLFLVEEKALEDVVNVKSTTEKANSSLETENTNLGEKETLISTDDAQGAEELEATTVPEVTSTTTATKRRRGGKGRSRFEN